MKTRLILQLQKRKTKLRETENQDCTIFCPQFSFVLFPQNTFFLFLLFFFFFFCSRQFLFLPKHIVEFLLRRKIQVGERQILFYSNFLRLLHVEKKQCHTHETHMTPPSPLPPSPPIRRKNGQTKKVRMEGCLK